MTFEEIYKKWASGNTEEEKRLKETALKKDGEDSSQHFSINRIRKMNCQAELDLHSFTVDQASDAVSVFLKESYNKGLKKIRIIHGKGLHSENGVSPVKRETLLILKYSPYVRETITPPASDGGSGAEWVILKSKK